MADRALKVISLTIDGGEVAEINVIDHLGAPATFVQLRNLETGVGEDFRVTLNNETDAFRLQPLEIWELDHGIKIKRLVIDNADSGAMPGNVDVILGRRL